MAILGQIVKTQGLSILKLWSFWIELFVQLVQRPVGYFSELYL